MLVNLKRKSWRIGKWYSYQGARIFFCGFELSWIKKNIKMVWDESLRIQWSFKFYKTHSTGPKTRVTGANKTQVLRIQAHGYMDFLVGHLFLSTFLMCHPTGFWLPWYLIKESSIFFLILYVMSCYFVFPLKILFWQFYCN